MNNPDTDARNAPQSLLFGSIQQSPYLPSHSHIHGSQCTPCHHYVMTEDIISGMRQNGRMSVVRRSFCLLIIFDFLINCLMWLICLVLAGNFDFHSAFESEIVHYNIKTSLFDVVMGSAARLLILLLFYAILQVGHCIIVALSTFSSSAFLVYKVYIFTWTGTAQPVFQVLLILASFVISWSEVWFMDLRVIPQERLAKEYLSASTVEETAPLLNKFLDINAVGDAMSESVGTFYSPKGSPEGSDEEWDHFAPPTRGISSRGLASNYRSKAKETLETAWQIIHRDHWDFERKTDAGEFIYSQKLNKQTKVFKLFTKVEYPVNFLFDILWRKISEFPSWNPSFKESRVFEVIDDHTDICYQVSADKGGIISSRDFVLLRHWEWKYESLVIASSSTTYPCLPCNSQFVRGENGPSCWILKDVSTSEGTLSEVSWLLNTNVKGWLPAWSVEAALASTMVDFMTNLKLHLSKESTRSEQ